jgi:hypothetical protein
MQKRNLEVKDILTFLLALFVFTVGFSALRDASYFAAIFWIGTSLLIAFKQYKAIHGGLSDPSTANKVSVVENSLVTMLLAPFALVLFGASYLVGSKANTLSGYIVVLVLIALGLAIGFVIYRNWLPKK